MKLSADNALVSAAESERPDEAAVAAISAGALVLLDQPTPSAMLAWAARLVPGSLLTAHVKSHQGWPDFARVLCSRHDAKSSITLRRERTPETPTPAPLPPPRPRPLRPLRSVFLGDLAYNSLYRAGVAQGMTQHGAWHRDVSLRDDAALIDRQIREMRPDLIFTHMLLWPPANAQVHTLDLLGMAEGWRRNGAVVLVHDADPRDRTRWPFDVSCSVDLALVNHHRPVQDWNVPALYWPYAALAQDRIGAPLPEYRADLAFAGLLREGGLYGARTAFVRTLERALGLRVYEPQTQGCNNRMLIADIAPSCIAMIGFGREVPGWIDTRVFTVPGAGGVLLHDDVGAGSASVLAPFEHYVPVTRYDLDSVAEALARARYFQDQIRAAAFAHVQERHTYRQRIASVLDAIYEPVAATAAAP